jgi:hypothetical protein
MARQKAVQIFISLSGEVAYRGSVLFCFHLILLQLA